MPKHAIRVCLCPILVACLLRAAPLCAGSNRSVSGVVFDSETGLPVEQAQIRIIGSSLSAQTGSHGTFVFLDIPTGDWDVEVERVGYVTRRVTAVHAAEGFERHLRIGLDPLPIVLPPQDVLSAAEEVRAGRCVRITAEHAATQNLENLLARIPGVRVYGSPDSPGGVRVSVGGEPPYRVAVTLDGLPLSGGPDGAVDLNAIPLSALTAIEVRPGSQTAIAGDAAVGGVINLVSHRSVPDADIRLRLQSGSWGQHHEQVTASTDARIAAIDVGLEHLGRSGRYDFMTDADTSGERHNVERETWRGFLTANGLQASSLRLTGFASHSDNGAPGTVERPTLTARGRLKNGRIQAGRELSLSRDASASLAAWYEFTSEYYNSMGERPAYQYHTYTCEHFAGLRAGYSRPLLAGASHVEVEERVRSLYGDDYQRPHLAFGGHDRIEHTIRGRWSRGWRSPCGHLSTSAGFSLDADHDDRPAWSPRVDASFQITRGVTATAGWGRSFRRAPLLSLFWKEDYHAQGNPDLKPERGREWDIGGRVTRGPLSVDTRYFERKIDDIIVWDLRGPSPKYQPVNLDQARVIGREDHIGVETKEGEVSLDYTHVFNDATDESGDVTYDGKSLIFTPRHTHEVSVNVASGPIQARVSGRWVSSRYTLRANTKSQPSYRTFDAQLQLTPVKQNPLIVITLRGENITNEAIELMKDYPSPARSIMFGLAVELE